mmetsp:Transcript_24178/g.4041  ORF Transcript_24178/g.4041 Transcript_24178/m.4041 type:complete len:172 (+) Transcript_24178:1825-2340(+)
MEVIVDYGYVVMFSVAFPLVPICSLILTLIEIRVDAWKLCYLTRRPYPGPAVTLGIWFSIIQFISFAGVLTNTSILIFTTDVFDMSNENYKWLIFMALEHGLLVFKFGLSALVEDEPEKVLKSAAWRRRIINERIYHRPADQDEQKELRNLKFRPIPDYQPMKFEEDEIDD